MFDDRRVRDGGVGAADLLGHVRVGHAQALDVSLVDNGLVVLVLRWPVVTPVEERVDDDRQHGVAQGVGLVQGVGVIELVAEQ